MAEELDRFNERWNTGRVREALKWEAASWMEPRNWEESDEGVKP